jgi:poly-gamma-glutamate synthesis protein (capsule biosynthesis protein)
VVPPGWAATASAPGVASAYDLRAATDAVRAAHAQADHVVVLLHAGVESTECPTSSQRSLSAALVDAGADVVASAHPHVLQGIERRGNALVHYSLGNFVWYTGNAMTALLSVDLGPTGVDAYDAAPVRIDDTGSPQPLAGDAANQQRAYLASLAPGGGRC